MTAVLIAFIFPLVNATAMPRVENIALMGGLAIFVCGYKWFFHHKTAQLIRIGKSEIFIQTRTQCKLLNWDQVKEIKRVPVLGAILLKTRGEWFNLIFARKDKETVSVIEDNRRIAIGQLS